MYHIRNKKSSSFSSVHQLAAADVSPILPFDRPPDAENRLGIAITRKAHFDLMQTGSERQDIMLRRNVLHMPCVQDLNAVNVERGITTRFNLKLVHFIGGNVQVTIERHGERAFQIVY